MKHETTKNEINVSIQQEDIFVLIEASKLKRSDEIMQHVCRTHNEVILRRLLSEVIRKEIKDFYRPIIDPSFDEKNKIAFIPGGKPAIGKNFEWWKEVAKEFMPERKSRLGTRNEYIAFLGVLMKKMVSNGWDLADTWDAICNDSKELGIYNVELDDGYDCGYTGTNEICDFFDLANTFKILANEEHSDYYAIASGDCNSPSVNYPLSRFSNNDLFKIAKKHCVGWIVLEK